VPPFHCLAPEPPLDADADRERQLRFAALDALGDYALACEQLAAGDDAALAQVGAHAAAARRELYRLAAIVANAGTGK
jgi:hypothetical protein